MHAPNLRRINLRSDLAMRYACSHACQHLYRVHAKRYHAGDTRMQMYAIVGAPIVQVQNIRPGYRAGLLAGLVNSVLESYVYPVVLGGPPWRLSHRFPDHAAMRPAAQCRSIGYPECAVGDCDLCVRLCARHRLPVKCSNVASSCLQPNHEHRSATCTRHGSLLAV